MSNKLKEDFRDNYDQLFYLVQKRLLEEQEFIPTLREVSPEPDKGTQFNRLKALRQSLLEIEQLYLFISK